MDENSESEQDLKKTSFSKKKIILLIFISVIFLAGFVYFGNISYNEYKEQKNADDTWNEIRNVAYPQGSDSVAEESNRRTTPHRVIDDSLSLITEEPPKAPNKNIDTDENMFREPDLKSVSDINSDVFAWIYVPDTMIDYPVVQESVFDEYFYLYRDVYKNNSVYGSIFCAAPKNKENPNDIAHRVIYGHNMRNGTMFGELSNYKSFDFYREHPYFYMYYPDRTERWVIWSVAHLEAKSDIYNPDYRLGDSSYKDTLEYLQNIRYYDTGISNVSPYAKTITLSTCDWLDGNDSGGRMVVTAVLDKTFVWN